VADDINFGMFGGNFAAVTLTETDDDGDSEAARLRRETRHKETPLNTGSVTVPVDSRHLGVTVRNARTGHGVVIEQLNQDDAAAKAGLNVGDWIITVNGQLIESHRACITLVNASLHQEVPIAVTYMTRALVAVDLHPLHLKGTARQHLGVRLQTEPGQRGAQIVGLQTRDVLAGCGLQVGDVITHVGGRRVFTPEQAMHEMCKRNWFKPRETPRVVEIEYMTSKARSPPVIEGKPAVRLSDERKDSKEK